MDEFVEGQRGNLDQIMDNPRFRGLLHTLNATYVGAVAILPKVTAPIIFSRIFLVCHKSFLSAATLIAQGQPEDSTAITRRALEAARVARALKLDRANAKLWTAYQERHDRWLRRQQNKRPRHFSVRYEGLQGDQLIDRIDTHMGILSDSSVHFTPEFYSRLDWEEKRREDGSGEIFLNYFQRSPREIELSFTTLVAAHLTILETLNECFDSSLTQDEVWRAQIVELRSKCRTFHEEYRRRFGIDDEDDLDD